MTTLSDGTTTITPTLVTGYQATAESRNVIHNVIGRADDDVSVIADALRTGSLELFFDTRAAAWAAFNLHKVSAVFTLADADVPQVNMTYVRDGAMRVELDAVTRTRWLVSVGFKEVAA